MITDDDARKVFEAWCQEVNQPREEMIKILKAFCDPEFALTTHWKRDAKERAIRAIELYEAGEL